MTNKPLVSIIIPCYNHESFLDDCLNSIINQSYSNIELLICDDCSTDNSYNKILDCKEALEKRFNNVVIFKNETNLGVTKNINRMLSVANGEYIKILASDDALLPEAVEKFVIFAEENKDYSVFVSNGLKVPEEQHYPNFDSREHIYNEEPDFSNDGFMERMARCNPVFAPGAFVRKSVYDKFGLYDENIKIEDLEFWLRLLDKGVKFFFVNEILIYYRINQNSMSSMVNNEKFVLRRKLFLNSELETFKKYRLALESSVYADISLTRIFSERWLAIENNCTEFEKELKNMWKSFPYWKDLTLKRKLKLKFEWFKQDIKKLIK